MEGFGSMEGLWVVDEWWKTGDGMVGLKASELREGGRGGLVVFSRTLRVS